MTTPLSAHPFTPGWITVHDDDGDPVHIATDAIAMVHTDADPAVAFLTMRTGHQFRLRHSATALMLMIRTATP